MIAPLAKLMDWSAIQATTMLMPSTKAQSPRPEEALKFLKMPDSLPVESQPAQVEFDPDESGVHFRFPTPQPSDFAGNNTVYGRLYRCRERWQERPVIVLLHGAGDFPEYHFRFPLIGRRCNRMGLNVVTLVAPYHFQRRPRQLKASGNMDCLMIAKTATQAIAEIRALSQVSWRAIGGVARKTTIPPAALSTLFADLHFARRPAVTGLSASEDSLWPLASLCRRRHPKTGG